MLDLAWASFITRVAILWIRLEADRQTGAQRDRLSERQFIAFYAIICVASFPFFYLIFACTVSESSRFMGSGVTDPDAIQLVPGRLILMDPFP